MLHPLVAQLRFTRSEFQRALVGLTEDEAAQRFMPMNCISWNVGHLAWQEQRYFVYFAQAATAATQRAVRLWRASQHPVSTGNGGGVDGDHTGRGCVAGDGDR